MTRPTLALALSLLGALGCKDDKSETIDSAFDGGADDGGADVRRDDCDVPSEPDALIAYLRAGKYRGFKHESTAHGSAGPHSGKVLTYVNDTLFASLEAENDEHPVCSAAVKELSLSGDEPGGFAVYVKVREHSYDGAGWYWFETTSTSASAEPDFTGDGLALCANCHRGGSDYVLSPFPLQ